MDLDFTFLICTYNRAALLKRCLEHLGALDQALFEGVPVTWEVLVVDNRSTDGTAALVETWVARSGKDNPHASVTRLIREERQGVGFARRTGFAASAGTWIVFVDDDCALERDFLVEAARFIREHPDAGVIGGRNALEWEAPPPELAISYGESLARQDWGDQPQKVPDDGGKRALCGAGVLLRKEAIFKSGYLEDGMLTGRHPKTIGAGEDTEVQLLIRNAGWTLWYTPTLKLRHWIPKDRVGLPHLLALHRGFGEAEIYLRLVGARRPLTLANRLQGVGWALTEMRVVLARFWLGCVKYRNERPTWFIRLWYAWGCVKGALRLLVLGRAR